MLGPTSPARVLGRRLASIAVATTAVVSFAGSAGAQVSPDDPPSILLIVTDDQRWDTLWAMPEVQRSLVGPGVTFANAFTTSSLCCPSRASILTGGYPHTTGVYTQGLPYGGFKRFDDSTTIATELDAAGYRTGYFGKYLDSYQADALAGYVPPGWDRWVAFVHSQYFDYGLSVDGTIEPHGSGPEEYSTDVLASEAEAFIRSSDGPIFAVYAPAAPHAPATPAPRDAALFADVPAWDPPSFDEADVSDKPRHVRVLRRLAAQRILDLAELRRDQYRSLRSVDRAVGRLLGALEDTGRLDDAVVIYTSDNGLLWGEHRWFKKEVPYEEAIRVPLLIRADAVVTAHADEHLVANIDVAPTIADAAGVELPAADGASLLPLVRGETVPWRTALLIEHVRGTNPIPTYCAVRTPGQLFVRYDTGERELYDLQADPAELENLAGRRPALEARLETALHGLCDPPPPGFTNGGGASMVVLALAGTLLLAAVARSGLARMGRG